MNEVGGITFRFPSVGQFVKWAPHHPELDLAAEAERMRWAAPLVPRCPRCSRWVPTPTASGCGPVALPGRSAVDPFWRARPRTAARAIGTGLRRLHDRLPVADCPFSWTVETRVDRAAPTPTGRARWRCARRSTGWWSATATPARRTPCSTTAASRSVTSTSAASASADRWADLAVATYSLAWNFPGDWEDELLDAYGIARDEERIAYYRRLWDAT